MKLNTKIRYSLRMIILLASNQGVMNTIMLGEKMLVSPKYLRKLAGPLEKSKIIKSVQGIYGGYLLNKKPEDITLEMIFKANNVSPNISNCMQNKKCLLMNECLARPLWEYFESLIKNKFFDLTVRDILDKNYLETT